MRLKSVHGNSARASIASAAGTTSASTNRATARRNSSCSGVNSIIAASSCGARAWPVVHPEVEPRPRDHHAVLIARGLDRDVVVQDVLEHAPRIALERIAVASGTGLLERYDVAVGEPARLLAVDDLPARPGVDQRATERPGFAAEEPVRREPLAVREVRELALVGEEPHVAPDPAAAAEFPRAGGVADQLEALDDDRLV